MNLCKPLTFATAVLAFVLSTQGFAASSSRMASPKEIHVGKKVKQVEAEHLLVKFKDTLSTTKVEAVLSAHHSAKVESFQGRLANLHRISVPAGHEEEVLNSLKTNVDVEYAEYNELVPAHGVSNDSMVGNQWHLANTSVQQAWDISIGSNPVVVAILDSGVDTTHPDLVNRVTAGYNVVDSNTNVSDIHGHGTAAAGSAIADTNNGSGLSAPCWNCRVMPVRIAVLQNGGPYAYYSTIVTGMQWAVDHGAKILNISYGGLYSSSSIANAATYVKSKGGIVFASAGNDGAYLSSNLAPDIIFVSATNSSNAKTSWSNYGPIISVSAPGEYIYTMNIGGGYGSWSGTSFASPYAAGVAALLWSTNPSLTNTQVRSMISQATDDLGPAGKDDEFGDGKVNALKAVQLALSFNPPAATPTPTPTPVATPTPTPVPTQDTTAPSVTITSPAAGATVVRSINVTVNATDNVGVTQVSVYLDGALLGSSTTAPFTVSWNTRKSSVGSHTLTVKARDAAGNVGTSSSITVNVAR